MKRYIGEVLGRYGIGIWMCFRRMEKGGKAERVQKKGVLVARAIVQCVGGRLGVELTMTVVINVVPSVIQSSRSDLLAYAANAALAACMSDSEPAPADVI